MVEKIVNFIIHHWATNITMEITIFNSYVKLPGGTSLGIRNHEPRAAHGSWHGSWHGLNQLGMKDLKGKSKPDTLINLKT